MIPYSRAKVRSYSAMIQKEEEVIFEGDGGMMCSRKENSSYGDVDKERRHGRETEAKIDTFLSGQDTISM